MEFQIGYEFIDLELEKIQIVVSREGDSYLAVNRLQMDICRIQEEYTDIVLYPYTEARLHAIHLDKLRMEAEYKVNCAVGYLNHIYGGVTEERGFAQQLSIPDLMKRMRERGLVWDKTEHCWRDPRWELIVRDVQSEFGSAASTVLWG